MVAKRRVRKTSLFEKIKNYPVDLFLWINEIRLSIDWDKYCYSIAIPLGFICSSFFVILTKMSNGSNVSNNSSIFQTDYYNYELIKQRALARNLSKQRFGATSSSSNSSIWMGLNHFLTMVLFISSSINGAYVLWGSFRDYSLLYSDEAPNSPSVKSTSLSETDSSIFSFIGSMFEFLFKKDITEESFYDQDQDDSAATLNEINLFDKTVYQLKVWTPSTFQLYVLSSFNPISLLIIKFVINELSFWKILLTVSLFDIQLFFIVTKRFLILLNDKQILYQEMFQEYNDKFVKPKTNILKRDVAVDASRGPFAPVESNHTNPFFQNTKLKVFITHDINGKPYNSLRTQPQNPSSNENDDSFQNERQRFESEKIRFEMERKKFNQQVNSSVNNSMVLSLDYTMNENNDRLFSQSTPYKSKIPAPRSSHGGYYDSPSRLSPSRQSFNPRSVSPQRENRPPRSPFKSPNKTPIRSPYRSPERTFDRSRNSTIGSPSRRLDRANSTLESVTTEYRSRSRSPVKVIDLRKLESPSPSRQG